MWNWNRCKTLNWKCENKYINDCSSPVLFLIIFLTWYYWFSLWNVDFLHYSNNTWIYSFTFLHIFTMAVINYILLCSHLLHKLFPVCMSTPCGQNKTLRTFKHNWIFFNSKLTGHMSGGWRGIHAANETGNRTHTTAQETTSEHGACVLKTDQETSAALLYITKWKNKQTSISS